MSNYTNVSVRHKHYQEKLPYYDLIEDCLGGSIAIKAKTTEYLPLPSDECTESDDRYKSYIKRAMFYNVTARTLSGITGLVYLKDANYELPDLLEPLKVDCNGEGISLAQLSKRGLRWGMSFGRAGLFVDFPQLSGAVTAKDISSGDIQPIFRLFSAKQIVNWKTAKINGKVVLTLVVLEEDRYETIDRFATAVYKQYTILSLMDGVFTVEVVYAKDYSVETYIPTDSKGKPFNRIPFFFIGAENNDSEADHPPIYDLAEVNVHHYQNSADYEESVFTIGQPTLWYAGITQEWNDDVLGGKIRIGARGGLPLPEGGTAGILQVAPNTLAKEAMDQKEDQMLALGAKLVQATSGNRTTATEASINDASETSILVNVARNVSDAFTAGLQFACEYVGANPDDVLFELQADLEITKMDSQQLTALVDSWQKGAISRTEMRYNLRKSGVAHGNENDMIAEIEKEESERQFLQDKQSQAKQNQGVDNGSQA